LSTEEDDDDWGLKTTHRDSQTGQKLVLSEGEALHYLPHLSWASTFWFWTARENNNIAPRTHPVHCNALGVWLCSGGSASSSSVALTCLCANQTHTAPRRELALGTGNWDLGSGILDIGSCIWRVATMAMAMALAWHWPIPSQRRIIRCNS